MTEGVQRKTGASTYMKNHEEVSSWTKQATKIKEKKKEKETEVFSSYAP